MITLTILAILALIILVGLVITGAGVLLAFGDIIVCALILYLVIKHLRNRRH